MVDVSIWEAVYKDLSTMSERSDSRWSLLFQSPYHPSYVSMLSDFSYLVIGSYHKGMKIKEGLVTDYIIAADLRAADQVCRFIYKFIPQYVSLVLSVCEKMEKALSIGADLKRFTSRWRLM